MIQRNRFLLPSLFVASALAGCVPAGASIVIDPLVLDFGEVPLGERSSREFTVSNEGGSEAFVSLALSGSDTFSLALNNGVEVFPGDQLRVFVDALPTAVGVASATLDATWADGSAVVELTAEGVFGADDDNDDDGFSPPEDCDDDNPDVYPGAPELCNGVDDDCNDAIDDTGDADGDGVDACDDCDDGEPAAFPGNTEACDGIDNDCDDATDEDFDLDGDGSRTCDDVPDCDDDDPGVFPGAAEVCNGLDEDCDGEVDEDFFDAAGDVDQDGEPFCTDCDDDDPTSFPGAVEVCDEADNDCNLIIDDSTVDGDGDGTFECFDCDDADAEIRPGAIEVCDGVDNDCDGGVDEDDDSDGDGFTTCGADGVAGNADDDCDDTNAAVNPGAPEICDGIDNDCDGVGDDSGDGDGDGITACDGDCDDGDPAVFPGAMEFCDGIDSDCNGLADFDPAGEVDGDGDGSLSCADCDDAEPAAFPGNPEVCDGIDNDCDGAGDDLADADGDGVTACDGDCDDADGANFPGNAEACDGADNDCSGSADFDADGEVDGDGDGSLSCADCDDADGAVFPGAAELCDGADQDCDGVADNGLDTDGDGVTPCGPDGVAATADDDCDDADITAFPGATEACDGDDEDCDGAADNGLDGDGDGVTPCGPDGVAGNADDDCDDANIDAFPGAPEVCGAPADLDCDGTPRHWCASCADVLAADATLQDVDGIHTIDTDGAAGPLAPVDAFCDLTTDGGGWTLVLSVGPDAATNLTLPADGVSTWSVPAGTPAADVYRLPAQHWNALASSGDVMASYAVELDDGSACDPLRYATVGGTLAMQDPTVGPSTYSYVGPNVNWIVGNDNPAVFRVSDFDVSNNCVANGSRPVPWFYNSGCGLVAPGFFGGGRAVVRSDLLVSDLDGQGVADVCGAGTPDVVLNIPPADWYLVSTMEFFFR